MVKKKRAKCLLCNSPLVYCGDGCPSKYCPTCATKQQKKNTKIARQIRIIKKRIKVLWYKIPPDYDPKDIRKLSDELDKLDKKEEEQKIQKLEVKEGKKTQELNYLRRNKIKLKEKEAIEIMVRQLKDRGKLNKVNEEIERLKKS